MTAGRVNVKQALTPAAAKAKTRAYRIRVGIRSYIHTLGDIAAAWQDEDWKALGYKSWGAYVEGEFGAKEVGLPPEQRQKAIEELRIAGLTNRAIAAALNVNEKTIRRDSSAANAAPIEGEIVDPPARSPLVEAMTGAIEDAEERTKNPGVAAPAPAEASSPAGPHGKPAVGGNAGVEVPPASTPAPQDHPGSFSADPGETESAGNTSEPGGPVLTARVGTSTAAGAVTPAAPAAPQGQERSEGFRCPACLRPLGAAA